ncbi:MAG TPA: hypothetical protein VF989_12505 [Polyangiaceae bacterium]
MRSGFDRHLPLSRLVSAKLAISILGALAISARCRSGPPPSTGPCRPGLVRFAQTGITDWPRGDLERLRRSLDESSLLFVAYDGCEVRPLWDCRQPGADSYRPEEKALVLLASDDASATTIGQFTTSMDVSRTTPGSDCQGATHAIASVTTGTLTRSTPDGEEVFGDPEACAARATKAGCDTPLVVQLMPLVAGKVADCPEGYQRRGDDCVLAEREQCPAGTTPRQTPEGRRCVPDAPPACDPDVDEWCKAAASGYYRPAPGKRGAGEINRLLDECPKREGSARARCLLALAELYRSYHPGSPEAQRSRLLALFEFSELPGIEQLAETPRALEELVELSADFPERSRHLAAANRLRELYPHAPETASAYLALARHFCSRKEPELARRSLQQMRESIKGLPKQAAQAAREIELGCAQSAAAGD